ncbi:MAG: SgcJ/EcaC family oxidoreductase [Planctomycetaceae bacterium]
MRSLCWVAGLLLCGLFLVYESGAQERKATAARGPGAAASNEPNTKDRAAIDAINAEFTRAFNAGDAAALAKLFTVDARMTDEAGKTVEGREAIQKQLAESFRETPGVTITLRTDSLKFLSPEAAFEEGASQLHVPGEEDAEFNPYSAAYVKVDGQWLHAIVRDYPPSESNAAVADNQALQELDWMVGEWVEEDTDGKALSSCRWAQNNHFLVWEYTVDVDGANAPGGTMFIGRCPLTGQIKSWLFDANGGHGEATWTRHGDSQWVVKASGVLGDGRVASATQYVTRLGADLTSWTSVDRVAGGEVQPDVSEYTIARKPPTPKSSGADKSR